MALPVLWLLLLCHDACCSQSMLWVHLPCMHEGCAACDLVASPQTLRGISCSWQGTRSNACLLSPKASGGAQRLLGHQSRNLQHIRCGSQASWPGFCASTVEDMAIMQLQAWNVKLVGGAKCNLGSTDDNSQTNASSLTFAGMCMLRPGG